MTQPLAAYLPLLITLDNSCQLAAGGVNLPFHRRPTVRFPPRPPLLRVVAAVSIRLFYLPFHSALLFGYSQIEFHHFIFIRSIYFRVVDFFVSVCIGRMNFFFSWRFFLRDSLRILSFSFNSTLMPLQIRVGSWQRWNRIRTRHHHCNGNIFNH